MHYSLKPAVLVDRRIGILKNPNWFFFIVTILIHLTGLLWGSHEIIWQYFLKLWTVIAAVSLFLNNTSSLIAFHHSMSPSHNSKELKTRQFFFVVFQKDPAFRRPHPFRSSTWGLWLYLYGLHFSYLYEKYKTNHISLLDDKHI